MKSKVLGALTEEQVRCNRILHGQPHHHQEIEQQDQLKQKEMHQTDSTDQTQVKCSIHPMTKMNQIYTLTVRIYQILNLNSLFYF